MGLAAAVAMVLVCPCPSLQVLRDEDVSEEIIEKQETFCERENVEELKSARDLQKAILDYIKHISAKKLERISTLPSRQLRYAFTHINTFANE